MDLTDLAGSHVVTDTDWAWLWWLWAAFASLGFAVLETVAIMVHGRTLSEELRRLLGIDPPRWWKRIGAALLVATLWTFTAWFIPHLLGA